MAAGGSRRSSSSSSGSRSLSPYNKRRRGRSVEKSRKSPHTSHQKSHSNRRSRSRSPRRRPRSKSPRRYSPPPQRRRPSPGPQNSRNYGASSRSGAVSGRRGSPPRGGGRRDQSPPPRKRSPSPPPSRGRKRSSSPKRRTPSPKRRRSPERRNDRYKTPPPPPPPALPSRDRRSPIRRENRTAPQQVYSSTTRRSRSPSLPPYKQSSHQHRSHDQYKSTSPPYEQKSSRRSPLPSSSSYSKSHEGRYTDNRHSSRHRSRERKVTPPPPVVAPEMSHLGSKDMDYRDKRMGDPRAAKEQSREAAATTSSSEYRSSSKRGSGGTTSSSHGHSTTPSKRGESNSSKREIGNTGIQMNTRFCELDDTKDFKPKDLITIGIERNIIGDEPAVISPVYKSEYVSVPRRKGEGDKPLASREEFVTRQEEYVERRVIKVVQAPRDERKDDERNGKHNKFDMEGRENFEVRRDRMSLSQRWGGEEPKIEQKVSVRHESLKDSYPSSTRHVERRSTERTTSYRDDHHGDRDERLVQSRSKRDGHHSPVKDRDERIVSRDYRKDEDLRSKSNKERSKYEKDPNDLREKLARRRGNKDPADAGDARQKLERKRSFDRRISDEFSGRRVESRSPGKDLPDFSKRPDKGRYMEWEKNPEMIPKGSLYFEHDNRDDFDYWERVGRGRGWRGQRGSRGGYSFGSSFRGGRGSGGRGRGSYSKYEPDWQHDKFEEVEQPSSTTK